MKRLRAGSPLLHPVSLVALGLLLINDHFLKANHPSALTGKLSDVAFMVLAPSFLWVLLVQPPWRSRPSALFAAQKTREAVLVGCVVLVGSFFASMQLTSFGDAAFRYTLGVLQWPAHALVSQISTSAWPSLRPVVATPDPTDLLCLPLLGVAWWLCRDACCERGGQRG